MNIRQSRENMPKYRFEIRGKKGREIYGRKYCAKGDGRNWEK
jgi:hypothetical protein